MPDQIHTPLLSDEMLQLGAAIAALPQAARTAVLGGLLVRASDGADGILEDFDASDRSAELYLAATAAVEGVSALEILQRDPFVAANMSPHSTQFERLLYRHHYAAFCVRHPAEQPLATEDCLRFVGLMEGDPGTSSWHAPGHTPRDVVDLAARHAEEGLHLMQLWDLQTGQPAAADFVIGLSIHVQARDADEAYEHVARLVGDLDRETRENEHACPGIHHLHASGPYYGPPRGDIESVDSIPHLQRGGDRADALDIAPRP